MKRVVETFLSHWNISPTKPDNPRDLCSGNAAKINMEGTRSWINRQEKMFYVGAILISLTVTTALIEQNIYTECPDERYTK
jgi:hypothetical protein